MYHHGTRCGFRPLSVNATVVEREFLNRVLAYVQLDEGWREAVTRALALDSPLPDFSVELKAIERTLANLRKQHLWGAIEDEKFMQEFQRLDRRKKELASRMEPVRTPNLDRATELLKELPGLWEHPGVGDDQRRDFLD